MYISVTVKNFQIKYHFSKIFSVSLVLKCWFINVPNLNQMVDTVPAQAIDNAERLGRGVALFARALDYSVTAISALFFFSAC